MYAPQSRSKLKKVSAPRESLSTKAKLAALTVAYSANVESKSKVPSREVGFSNLIRRTMRRNKLTIEKQFNPESASKQVWTGRRGVVWGFLVFIIVA